MIEKIFSTNFNVIPPADDKECACGCWCPPGHQPKVDDFNDDKTPEIKSGTT